MTAPRRLLWSALPLLFACLIGEALARTWPPPDPRTPARGNPDEILLHGNPWLLWELQPGDREEKGRPVHINMLGFRDRDRGEKTRPRVLALGDSSVYGFGVRDDEVFTHLLESTFDADFINGAVPGYSTFQALNLLDMRGFALEPDLLIVGSLWSDNNFDSFTDKDLLATYAGWTASRAAVVRTVFAHSAVFRWLDWTVRVAPQGAAARAVGWQVGGTDPRTGYRRVQVNDYAANLDAFCERMEARGGGVMFLMLANTDDIHPLAEEPAWEVYRQVMRDTARRHGAPLVDIPAAFRTSGRSADALFLDAMHPSVVGQAIMADAVAQALRERGWPAAPLRLTPATEPRPGYSDAFEGNGIGQPLTPAP